MLNRTIAPDFIQVNEINFIKPKAQQLDNGIKVFTVNAGQQELVRIEFIFQNVNYDQNKPLQAVSVNSLINNGTKKLSAKQIANKHLVSVLPIIWSILNESIFPQQELDIFIQNQKQKLKVNLQKNDFLARKTFANTIFGETAYGSDISMAHYDDLKRDDLLAYFKAAFKPENCTIIAAGKFEAKEFDLLNQFFGKSWENHNVSVANEFNHLPIAGSDVYIEKAEAVQSAIRMGNLTINRKHEDFAKLQIVNTLLGGYFGSRLMANIREDKGYTYGIGSGIASLRHAGYFFIATEVGTEVCVSALEEIEKEINILKTELVVEEELGLVRNYMLGSMLGSLENAFSHADKFKNIYFSDLDYDYYTKYIQTVKTITPTEIIATANQYLDWNAMTKVVVGKK